MNNIFDRRAEVFLAARKWKWQHIFLFSTHPNRMRGPSRALVEEKQSGREVNHLHLVESLRISGSMPLFPYMSLCGAYTFWSKTGSTYSILCGPRLVTGEWAQGTKRRSFTLGGRRLLETKLTECSKKSFIETMFWTNITILCQAE